MAAVVNLRHEPKLREAFEYAQVVNNTVLIDRRTKWGNPFRVTDDISHAEAVARYRVHLWRRIRAGEIALEELAELAGMLVRRRRPPLPRRGARTGGRLGGAGAGRKVRCVTRRCASFRTLCRAEPPMGSVQVERIGQPS